MQYFDPRDLDEEERAEYEAIEEGDYINVPDFKTEKAKAEAAARSTLNKTRNINIRLTQGDIYKLKAKAAEEGIPYQTLAASILHKSTSAK